MAHFIATIQLHPVKGSEYDLIYKGLHQSLKIKPRLYKEEAFMDGTNSFILGDHNTLQCVNEEVFKQSSRTGIQHSFFVLSYKKDESE